MYQSRFITRMAEITVKYPPEVTANASPELIKQINAEMQAVADEELWSTAEVVKEYNLSRQNLHNINKRYEIPGRFKLGGVVLYEVQAAKPWFDAYVARNGGSAC